MTSMIDLLGLYHNYAVIVELILELYYETAKRMICYLGHNSSRSFYQKSIDVIRMYAHHNMGKRSVEKEAEEEQYRDILFLMELLTFILSKDFIDLAPPENNTEEDGVTAADVCLFGLNIIMPMMSAELFKFPSLCNTYFKTVTLVCELYPEKICGMTDDLRKNLIGSLELGLTGIGGDSVYTICCDFIQVLVMFIVKKRKQDGANLHMTAPMYEAMRPFLKVRKFLFNFILNHKKNRENLFCSFCSNCPCRNKSTRSFCLQPVAQSTF